MTMTTINGFPIYAVTSKEVKPGKPSYFAEQFSKWVEGSRKEQLSEEEIEKLKKKYNSGSMSKEDSVSFMGELVEAWIISKVTARNIYYGFIPLDESKVDLTKNQSFLTKCDDAYERRMNFSSAFHGLGVMVGTGGIDYYRNWYEYAKSATDVDVDTSRYFQDCKRYLDILEQISS